MGGGGQKESLPPPPPPIENTWDTHGRKLAHRRMSKKAVLVEIITNKLDI